MNRRLLPLAVVLVAILTNSATAGIFFKKQAKPDPKERVPALIATLKTDPDENKRGDAAKELREFDPAAFPELIAVLIETLQQDPKPAVRSQAAESLGKLRPISQQVGASLEQAAAQDPSMRVRMQARSSLWGYHFAGYRSPKGNEAPPSPASAEANGGRRPPTGKGIVPVLPAETAPPPLAPPAITSQVPAPPMLLAPGIQPTPVRPRQPAIEDGPSLPRFPQ